MKSLCDKYMPKNFSSLLVAIALAAPAAFTFYYLSTAPLLRALFATASAFGGSIAGFLAGNSLTHVLPAFGGHSSGTLYQQWNNDYVAPFFALALIGGTCLTAALGCFMSVAYDPQENRFASWESLFVLGFGFQLLASTIGPYFVGFY